jgi:FlaA1/EpsC-like NDP-sugar epimerase
VLVTGAGGSIGSEICRQAMRFCPQRLLLVERAENCLFEIDRELRHTWVGADVRPVVADVCDAGRVGQIFADERPQVVFHCAAHKHVPMMEANPGEAVKNNVFGTRTLVDESIRCGVQAFVMISTDKAVKPTSVMGTTKCLAEMYVQALSEQADTRLVTVRFGNVLGSNGSVVPLFKEQIRNGGPVTVTHPEMTRYFMTIPEASQLVLQAGAQGRGGEIFVLDMGEPIKVLDLARDMIRLSGLEEGREIEIVFTGLRPGEKLREELYDQDEEQAPTLHPKIFAVKRRPCAPDWLRDEIDDLARVVEGPAEDVIVALSRLVPAYHSDLTAKPQARRPRVADPPELVPR